MLGNPSNKMRGRTLLLSKNHDYPKEKLGKHQAYLSPLGSSESFFAWQENSKEEVDLFAFQLLSKFHSDAFNWGFNLTQDQSSKSG